MTIDSAWAQRLSEQTELQVRQAFHGTDLTGKDGPLASVGYDLARLFLRYEAHRKRGEKTSFEPIPARVEMVDGSVTIEAVAKPGQGEALLKALEGVGMRGGAIAGRLVSGTVPIEAIPDIATLSTLVSARPAIGFTHAGSVVTQGDAVINADQARTENSVTGAGTTVAALSDSYNTLGGEQDDINSGDLPEASRITVLEDASSGGDEGRALLQIVHDIAPGADLAFKTAKGGRPAFAQAIRDLATDPSSGGAGADVIVDDFLYSGEPFFQDGVVAQAVDEVVADGVVYVSAAGNFGDLSYEDTFTDSGQDGPAAAPAGDQGSMHDFDPTSGIDTFQQITVPNGREVFVILQWEDPYPIGAGSGAENDLDLFLLDSSNSTVLASSVDDELGGEPYVDLSYTNTSGSAQQYNLAITFASGASPADVGKIKHIITDFQQQITIDEYATDSGTLFGHSNAAGAISVGATRFDQASPPQAQYYSSKGGVSILFDTDGNPTGPIDRQKPDVTAPDCVNNTFFGGDSGLDPDSFPNFCGSSAASPHVAGVAALMLEKDPSLTPAGVAAGLEDSAIDITQVNNGGPSTATGYDPYSGAGLIQADAASPLPVELTAFDAVSDGEGVLLTWRTATETNNAGFEVQRHSAGGGDWTALGFVEGAGTTTRPQTYRFRAADLAPGRHRFRLKQIDRDGAVEHSPVVEATVALASAYRLTAPHPNPSSGRAEMELTVRRGQSVRAVVYDALGRQVATLYDGAVEANAPERLTVEGNRLASGLYVVRVVGEAFTAQQKLTIVR